MMVSVIKIGGHILDDLTLRQQFLSHFAYIPGPKILVHGGGKIATQIAAQWQIPTTMIDGRRVTDAKMLDIVTMVYGGLVNKQVVAQLQAHGCNAIGLTGADGASIRAVQRSREPIDYGFVGDVREVNADFFSLLLKNNYTPIVAPLTLADAGHLLNTNADTMASAVAVALSKHGIPTQLFYCFEKSGVLYDAEDNESVIPTINYAYYQQLRKDNIIFAGMIPKMDNAFAAIRAGVESVWIGSAENIHQFWSDTMPTGTLIQEK